MGFSNELFIQLQDELINTGVKVENGEMSYLEALVYYSEQEEYMKQSLEIIKEFKDENISNIDDEVRERNGEPYKGFEFKVVPGRKMIDYKGIKEWNELESKKKEVENKYKTVLSSYERGVTPVNEDTGEVLEMPKVTFGKSYLTIRKSK